MRTSTVHATAATAAAMVNEKSSSSFWRRLMARPCRYKAGWHWPDRELPQWLAVHPASVRSPPRRVADKAMESPHGDPESLAPSCKLPRSPDLLPAHPVQACVAFHSMHPRKFRLS